MLDTEKTRYIPVVYVCFEDEYMPTEDHMAEHPQIVSGKGFSQYKGKDAHEKALANLGEQFNRWMLSPSSVKPRVIQAWLMRDLGDDDGLCSEYIGSAVQAPAGENFEPNPIRFRHLLEGRNYRIWAAGFLKNLEEGVFDFEDYWSTDENGKKQLDAVGAMEEFDALVKELREFEEQENN